MPFGEGLDVAVAAAPAACRFFGFLFVIKVICRDEKLQRGVGQSRNRRRGQEKVEEKCDELRNCQ